MLIINDPAELATLRAALSFYRSAGLGDPSERSDDVHELATDCGNVMSSLDDDGIEELDTRICEAQRAPKSGAPKGTLIEQLEHLAGERPDADARMFRHMASRVRVMVHELNVIADSPGKLWRPGDVVSEAARRALDAATHATAICLPAQAFIDNRLRPDGTRVACNTQAPVIAVRRGEAGFWPIFHASSADELNAAFGVTPAQREAMYAGSLFGWDTPAADPALYDEQGLRHPASTSSAAPGEIQTQQAHRGPAP